MGQTHGSTVPHEHTEAGRGVGVVGRHRAGVSKRVNMLRANRLTSTAVGQRTSTQSAGPVRRMRSKAIGGSFFRGWLQPTNVRDGRRRELLCGVWTGHAGCREMHIERELATCEVPLAKIAMPRCAARRAQSQPRMLRWPNLQLPEQLLINFLAKCAFSRVSPTSPGATSGTCGQATFEQFGGNLTFSAVAGPSMAMQAALLDAGRLPSVTAHWGRCHRHQGHAGGAGPGPRRFIRPPRPHAESGSGRGGTCCVPFFVATRLEKALIPQYCVRLARHVSEDSGGAARGPSARRCPKQAAHRLQ